MFKPMIWEVLNIELFLKINSTKLKLFFLEFILEPRHFQLKKVVFVFLFVKLKSPKPWGP